ncbi:DUF402 domain-containing protein [Microbacterium sp. CIAB417]|uniref:DUF402 domain-containing protein n=1 Tax=Microbacterium sp. CIAB417 TaxID=2860287 RepID=UPI001FACD73F|nr:DUF402 domain-containing protein [Microbacterium sp. CIAB417]
MSDRPAPGTEMIFQWRKWDGSPHWRHECVYLGTDQWGDWVGQPAGYHSFRPGAAFDAETPNVTLVPPSADFALTVNRDHPRDLRVYIDIAWDVRWSDDPLLATGIDMDLDVIRRTNAQGTYVDDRDEWAEHSARYGYPADVMERLEALTLDLEERVRGQVAPFDDATGDAWLDRLAALGLDRPLAR